MRNLTQAEIHAVMGGNMARFLATHYRRNSQLMRPGASAGPHLSALLAVIQQQRSETLAMVQRTTVHLLRPLGPTDEASNHTPR